MFWEQYNHEPNIATLRFRGVKGTLWEGGIRSPLIVWAPGRIAADKAGAVNDRSVFAAFDLAPSLLKLADVSAPEGVSFDGEDVSDTLLGKSEASRKAPVFWRRPPDRKVVGQPARRQPDLAVREGNWKLLCEYDGSESKLFDLAADPGESKDLAQDKAEVAARLSKAAVAWHESLPADRGPALGAKKKAGAEE